MDSSDRSRSPSLEISSPLSTNPSTPPEIDECFCSAKPSLIPSTSDRNRWRPSYHLMPATGWINDPCAPGYDPKTGTYSVSFQWNPNGPDWGEICWGTATSKDMVNWSILDEPTLSPDAPYDGLGVFTGCFIASQVPDDGTLTVAYTSVSNLPIHHTLRHVRGSESLSLATSLDGGRNWTKLACNPILHGEPDGLTVTGWRDPFVARWPSMARALNCDADGTMFGIVSGGIRDVTPTSFLYAINSTDLTRWQYIGPLVNIGLNKRLSRWSGDLGTNWEVTNFMTLSDGSDASLQRDFLVMGTEGCLSPPAHDRKEMQMATRPTRPVRGQLWMSGTLQSPMTADRGTGSITASGSSPVQMDYDFGGHLDHGCFYAANSFFDVRSGKQIVWGWVTEDDLCDELRHKQGWSGLLSLPRELKIQTLRYAVRASASRLIDLTNIEREEDEYGTFTIRTLGSAPLDVVRDELRQRDGVRRLNLENAKLDKEGLGIGFVGSAIQTSQWEIKCTLRLSASCRSLGFSIDDMADPKQSTTLSFRPSTETFTITRPSFPTANSADLINSSPEIAPHTLFTCRDPTTRLETTEALEIHAWRDNSVLEVFVNGRTAISTRIYAGDKTDGIRFFSDDGEGGLASELLEASLWDGIGIA